jgi:hypothetical protein
MGSAVSRASISRPPSSLHRNNSVPELTIAATQASWTDMAAEKQRAVVDKHHAWGAPLQHASSLNSLAHKVEEPKPAFPPYHARRRSSMLELTTLHEESTISLNNVAHKGDIAMRKRPF